MRQALNNLNIRHLGIRYDHALGIQPQEWTSLEQDAQIRAKDRFLAQLAELQPETNGYGPYLADLRKALGEPIEVRFPGPLAVGLGQGHLLEQGLTLHWLFGTPLIHGSAVKGVCLREALIQCGLLEEADRSAKRNPSKILDFARLIDELRQSGEEAKAAQAEALRQVFGDPGGAGQVRFHDALWVPDGRSPLAVDVTNPHNQKWYMPDKPSHRPLPDDTQAPIPVKNLVVRPGSRFYFWIVPEHDEWRDQLRNLLLSALRNLGIGAKTNVGYGAAEIAGAPGKATEAGSAKPQAASAEQFANGQKVTGILSLRQGQHLLQVPGSTQALLVANPEACGDKIGAKFRGRRVGNRVWIEGPA